MSCYVDPLFVMQSRNAQAFRVGARSGHRWCHLFTDGPLEELHTLAAGIGMKRSWFQADADVGHYDLTPSKREAALGAGALEVDRRRAMEIWRATREAAARKARLELLR